ncbi:MAG: hypothetical protein LBD42_00845 [Desulfovibrio sp.]|jgi:Fe-S-cluster containining protein|nr:hypothetical protein [Desulfovibrio sp.]
MNFILDNFIPAPALDAPAQGDALCRLCAEDKGGCCRTDPQRTYLSFPLSLPEWRRLVPYRHLATVSPPADTESFAREEERISPESAPLQDMAAPPPGGDALCAEEENRPDFISSMCALFTGQKKRIMTLFPVNGRHLSLRTRSDGSCAFLGSSGCRLPRSARPWYCLLFPAWLIGGSLTLFSSTDCLIFQKAYGPAHGIALLRSTSATVRMQHSALRKDWGLE